MENAIKSTTDQLLSKKEVAKRLALSVRTVDRLTTKGVLRRIKVLGAVRFRLSDVLAIMDGGAA